MIKPNIRGVNRRSLRFSLAGWRNSEDHTLIKHRYPWRRNWLEQLNADGSLKPLLARSGNIYLATQAAPGKSGKTRAIPKSRVALLFIGMATLLFFTISIVHFQNKPQRSVSVPSAAPVNCESMLKSPESIFQDWLRGNSNSKLTLTETQRAVLGGLQFRRVLVSCDQLQSDFRLTMTFVHGEWKLKKFARLDN